jgi:hypothetical protein
MTLHLSFSGRFRFVLDCLVLLILDNSVRSFLQLAIAVELLSEIQKLRRLLMLSGEVFFKVVLH